jgi:hypothetical protein
MNPIAKEKIYEELRQYHVEAFPAKLASDRIKDLKIQFVALEDRVIGMLLSLVNGKAVFTDDSSELNAFKQKIENPSAVNPEEENTLAVFVSKINRLLEMLTMAKNANFQLRKIRIKKTA